MNPMITAIATNGITMTTNTAPILIPAIAGEKKQESNNYGSRKYYHLNTGRILIQNTQNFALKINKYSLYDSGTFK